MWYEDITKEYEARLADGYGDGDSASISIPECEYGTVGDVPDCVSADLGGGSWMDDHHAHHTWLVHYMIAETFFIIKEFVD